MAADRPNSEQPALNGAAMARQNGFDLELADNVVLVFDLSLAPKRSLLPSTGIARQRRKAQHPFRAVAELRDGVDMVVAAGPGAPVAAITVEFLAALGAKRVVSVGVAGALGPDIVAGTPHVIASAIRDEGTSQYYDSATASILPDPELTGQLVEAVGGPALVTLSTDVPFRHTADRLASHRSRASLVDMECSALFAVARYFDLRPAALLIASDVFDGPTWRPADPSRTAATVRDAVTTAAALLGDSR